MATLYCWRALSATFKPLTIFFPKMWTSMPPTERSVSEPKGQLALYHSRFTNRDGQGSSCLHIAASRGDLAIVKALVEAKTWLEDLRIKRPAAEINKRDRRGRKRNIGVCYPCG